MLVAVYGTYAYNQRITHKNQNTQNYSGAEVKQTPYQSGTTITDASQPAQVTKPLIPKVPTVAPNGTAKSAANVTIIQGSNTQNSTTYRYFATPYSAANSATTAPKTNTNTSASATTGTNSYAAEVLRLVNVERTKAGLSAYTTNKTITSAANKRAQEISVSFSHTRPNGSSFASVLKDYGLPYTAAGENIAYGQKTPKEVVSAWMKSTGHRANILNKRFKKLGIGVYQKNGKIDWTQEFTN
jgi:Uncharacterized protein with SCP/PR1 domains